MSGKLLNEGFQLRKADFCEKPAPVGEREAYDPIVSVLRLYPEVGRAIEDTHHWSDRQQSFHGGAFDSHGRGPGSWKAAIEEKT